MDRHLAKKAFLICNIISKHIYIPSCKNGLVCVFSRNVPLFIVDNFNMFTSDVVMVYLR